LLYRRRRRDAQPDSLIEGALPGGRRLEGKFDRDETPPALTALLVQNRLVEFHERAGGDSRSITSATSA